MSKSNPTALFPISELQRVVAERLHWFSQDEVNALIDERDSYVETYMFDGYEGVFVKQENWYLDAKVTNLLQKRATSGLVEMQTQLEDDEEHEEIILSREQAKLFLSWLESKGLWPLTTDN